MTFIHRLLLYYVLLAVAGGTALWLVGHAYAYEPDTDQPGFVPGLHDHPLHIAVGNWAEGECEYLHSLGWTNCWRQWAFDGDDRTVSHLHLWYFCDDPDDPSAELLRQDEWWEFRRVSRLGVKAEFVDGSMDMRAAGCGRLI